MADMVMALAMLLLGMSIGLRILADDIVAIPVVPEHELAISRVVGDIDDSSGSIPEAQPVNFPPIQTAELIQDNFNPDDFVESNREYSSNYFSDTSDEEELELVHPIDREAYAPGLYQRTRDTLSRVWNYDVTSLSINEIQTEVCEISTTCTKVQRARLRVLLETINTQGHVDGLNFNCGPNDTPLIRASVTYPHCTKTLLLNGANPLKVTRGGDFETPVNGILEAAKSCTDCLQVYLELNVPIDTVFQQCNPPTAFLSAAQSNSLPSLHILESFATMPAMRTRNAFQLCISRNNVASREKVATINYLAGLGLDPDEISINSPPLLLAAELLEPGIIEALIQAGARPSTRTTHQVITPIQGALTALVRRTDYHGNIFECIRLLVAAGEVLNSGDWDAPPGPIGDFNALYFAIQIGNPRIVALLLELGADPDLEIRDSLDTPVLLAVDLYCSTPSDTRLRIASQLIHAAIVDHQTSYGNTAFLEAVSRRCMTIIEVLLAKNWNPVKTSTLGFSPHTLAIEERFSEVEARLRDAIKTRRKHRRVRIE